MRFFAIFVVATLLHVGIAAAETAVFPDTASTVMVAAGDSLFALGAGDVRYFDTNDLPAIETTVAANATVDLGNARGIEFKAFGAGAPTGMYLKVVRSGLAVNWYAHIFIGAADSVRVNAWLNDY